MRSLVLLICSLFWLVVPAQAQDNNPLSEEEMALLERALDARATLKTYTSYVEHTVLIESRNTTVRTNELSYTDEAITTTERTAKVIVRDGQKNITATLVAIFDTTEAVQAEDNGEQNTTQIIEAEARLVDEVLYVQAECPLCGIMGGETMPEGWVTVSDPNQFSAFSSLFLDYFFDGPSGLDARDVLLAQADSVKVAQEQTEDGTPVEVIYITFDATSTAAIVAENLGADSLAVRLFEEGSDQSGLELRISINDEGQMVGMDSILVIDLPLTDDPILTNGVAGAETSSHFVSSTFSTYTQINQPLDPAVAPE